MRSPLNSLARRAGPSSLAPRQPMRLASSRLLGRARLASRIRVGPRPRALRFANSGGSSVACASLRAFGWVLGRVRLASRIRVGPWPRALRFAHSGGSSAACASLREFGWVLGRARFASRIRVGPRPRALRFANSGGSGRARFASRIRVRVSLSRRSRRGVVAPAARPGPTLGGRRTGTRASSSRPR